MNANTKKKLLSLPMDLTLMGVAAVAVAAERWLYDLTSRTQCAPTAVSAEFAARFGLTAPLRHR